MALRGAGSYKEGRRDSEMMIKPIRTDADYNAALKAIEGYFAKPPRRGTVDAARFDDLAALIEAYEKKRWPIDPPRSAGP